ncbi:hypothetical protein QF035_011227 [Streptomyces umbrinus]|uniref:Uncharacterized protein n=1 Tax=Streptomyces umbrinus TaxID=67370 RepID=A0ABU0TCK8_9ACTN|nr:hypothetical protein [Streptomyces umbrinus]MDQ1033558.1 hypothetical protein [Streptomyces umbrinus]
MIDRPSARADVPEVLDGTTVFCPDLIIGRHPVHGVLADGHVDGVTVLLLEQAGFVYDEDLEVHRVPAGTSSDAEQHCVQRAMTSLSGRLSVAYLSDDLAAEAAGFARQQSPPA